MKDGKTNFANCHILICSVDAQYPLNHVTGLGQVDSEGRAMLCCACTSSGETVLYLAPSSNGVSVVTHRSELTQIEIVGTGSEKKN